VTTVLKVLFALFVVLLLAAAALRARKLRRDEHREVDAPVERRLTAPPPSPYTPSKGFRLLDGPVNEPLRPVPPRPRLEPGREYVFSESQLPDYVKSVSPLGRHDELWALSKSSRKSRISAATLRVLMVLVVLGVLAGFVGYYVTGQDHHPTTTTTLAPSRAASWPKSFVASSVNGETASYNVPVLKYHVSVTAGAGPVSTVIRMGAAGTLVFQGTIPTGTTKSVTVSGVSRVTLGSPQDASVSLGGSPVKLPSSLSSTLVLVFEPSSTGAG
jgi:hypothetical protein